MQQNRIDGDVARGGLGAAVAPDLSRVRGLGICDVLRIELEASQVPGAISELEERRGPLNEAFEQARTRWDEIADQRPPAWNAPALERELSRCAYALRVLGMVRAQLPALDHGDSVVVAGPAPMLADLIASAARNAVDDLGEALREPLATGTGAGATLRAAAAAVVAWIETYIESEALERYTFDLPYDPSDRIQ
jgi:hypothetical protein